jgi:hypothetical protein
MMYVDDLRAQDLLQYACAVSALARANFRNPNKTSNLTMFSSQAVMFYNLFFINMQSGMLFKYMIALNSACLALAIVSSLAYQPSAIVSVVFVLTCYFVTQVCHTVTVTVTGYLF